MFSKLRSKLGDRDQSPRPEPPEADRETLGLFRLNDAEEDKEYDVDIVAIHGLGGHWEKTWTDPSGKLWLRDFLPAEIPTARLFSYGYDSWTAFSKAVTNITDEAAMLLDRLDGERQGAAKMRPIIFVSHSLGGIIVKKALVIAHERSSIYADLLASARGSVFFGVPHRGSDVAYWASYAANLLEHAQLGFGTNSYYVKALQKKSPELAEISQQFIERGANLQIRTFFETKKMGNQLIVDKDSARLGLPNERAVGIAGADHQTMCKFARAGSQKYIPVRNAINELVKSAVVVTPASRNLSGEEEKCLQCLYTSDYESHRKRNPSRIPGTCEWFLRHPRYRTWQEAGHSSLLWVSADPGCGKSVLSSFLVDVLRGVHASSISPSAVCYFFFKDDNDAQRSVPHALSAVLHQLCDAKRPLIQFPLEEYRKKGDKFTAEIETLWNLIVSATAQEDCGTVICILDGLDECQAESRERLLNALVGFYSAQPLEQAQPNNAQLKFLVTSRPYPSIERAFHKLPTIRLKAEDETASISEDIASVVTARVKEIGEIRHLTSQVQSKLAQRLIQNADRTFLWVSLILRMIEDSARLSQVALQKMLGTIPDSLDAIYEKILAQSKDVVAAEKLLHIILAAAKPLSPQQLNIALCVDEHHQSLADVNDDLEPDIESTVKELCGLFVRVIDDRVYLVHQTAREFLTKLSTEASIVSKGWRHSLDAYQSHKVLAQSCIRYVLLWAPLVSARLKKKVPHYEEILKWKDEKRGDEEDRYVSIAGDNKNESHVEDQWSERIRVAPLLWKQEKLIARKFKREVFLEYSGAYWHVHFNKSNAIPTDPLCQTALPLCDPRSCAYVIWLAMYDLYFISHRETLWASDGTESYFRPTSLTTASALRLSPIVALLLQHGNFSTAEQLGAALFRASQVGDLSVPKLLLEEGGDWINMADKYGYTSLHNAVNNGNQEFVELLIRKGASIDMADQKGWTSLHCAVDNGDQELVELLIHKGASIHQVTKHGLAPIHFAAHGFRSSIMKILVHHKAAVEAVDVFGQTALFKIHKDTSEPTEIVSMEATMDQLLEAKANLEHRDNNGVTPLISYIRGACLHQVEALLKRGASTDGVNGRVVASALQQSLKLQHGQDRIESSLKNFQLAHSIVGRPLLRYGVEDDDANNVGSGRAESLWTQLTTYGKAYGYDLEPNIEPLAWKYGIWAWEAIPHLMMPMNILTVLDPRTGECRWKTRDELITQQVHKLAAEDIEGLLVRPEDLVPDDSWKGIQIPRRAVTRPRLYYTRAAKPVQQRAESWRRARSNNTLIIHAAGPDAPEFNLISPAGHRRNKLRDVPAPAGL